MDILHCTLCNKSLQKIQVLTEMHIAAYSQYVTPQGTLEDMNGQWKEVKEHICESCFEKIVKNLQDLRTNQQK